MLNLNTGTSSPTARIESDRDVLPFPSGGVHGPSRSQGEPAPKRSTSDDSMRLTRSIEAELDSLQQGIDSLTVQINEDEARDALASIPFHRFQSSSEQDPPTPAA